MERRSGVVRVSFELRDLAEELVVPEARITE